MIANFVYLRRLGLVLVLVLGFYPVFFFIYSLRDGSIIFKVVFFLKKITEPHCNSCLGTVINKVLWDVYSMLKTSFTLTESDKVIIKNVPISES